MGRPCPIGIPSRVSVNQSHRLLDQLCWRSPADWPSIPHRPEPFLQISGITMTHMTTPTTPAALQQQMLDLIEELRTAPSHRRQQRCLAQLEVLRYQLHSHVELLEQLAALLAVTGQALQEPAYSAVMRLAAVSATDWLV